MKTTYLIYQQVNGVQQLVAATQEEWDTIMKENKGQPMGKRRCFINVNANLKMSVFAEKECLFGTIPRIV